MRRLFDLRCFMACDCPDRLLGNPQLGGTQISRCQTVIGGLPIQIDTCVRRFERSGGASTDTAEIKLS